MTDNKMGGEHVTGGEMAIYPWQHETWGRLIAARERLPHALLLRGKRGIGKLDFAVAMANSLLCDAPGQQGIACGKCASCGWFLQDNHPDFRLLTPEQEAASDESVATPAKLNSVKPGKKSQISVSQIRELGSFLELSSHQGGGLRIALIHPAEALNQASANALLKMLEEPPAGVVFILVTHQAQRLLPTILSRCHKIDMPLPDRAAAVAWLSGQGVADAGKQLDYAGQSPLTVLANTMQEAPPLTPIWKLLAQGNKLDVFVLAPLLTALGMENAILALQKWCYDLLAVRSVSQLRYHADYLHALQSLAEQVDLALLLDLQPKLIEARKTASHPLNNELQLEALLLGYTRLFMNS